MAREDILSGLKHAMSKGESLRQAMNSFYNAGYKKEDIEEAGQEIQLEKQLKFQQEFPQQIYSQPPNQIQPTPGKTIQKISSYAEDKPAPQLNFSPPPKIQKQQISDYSSEQKKSKLGWIILISGTLAIVAVLIGILIFKEQFADFFNKLSG